MIRLHCGDMCAVIDEQHGANCVSLKNDNLGVSIVKEKDTNPYLIGMPVLFPVNRISSGCFLFEGRTYSFPINEPQTGCHIHGTLHDTPFGVIAQDTCRAVFRYTATEQHPYLSFPHAFSITITYCLTAYVLEQTITIQNHSDKNMPVMLGLHTTFNLPFSKGSHARNCRVRADIGEHYERRLGEDFLPTGHVLCADDVDIQLTKGDFIPTSKKISRLQRTAGEGIMSITDKKANLCVEYQNDVKYKFRLLYNGNADSYICLEPNTCIANCLNTNIEDNGFDYVEPNSCKQYTSRIILKRL